MAHRRAMIVTGLGFGDEGKGTTVDWLTRQTGSKLIVRYNGGAQAGHNVVTPDGVHHVFSQFGSGMLVDDPQIQTFLSQYMVIDPPAILSEAEHLKAVGVINPLDRLIIDERALVITPYHQIANRISEIARGDFKHGSCGVGVGEAVSDRDKDYAIHAGDLHNLQTLIDKLSALRESRSGLIKDLRLPGDAANYQRFFQDHSYIYETAHRLRTISKQLKIFSWYRIGDVFQNIDTPIFEGAQGALLDERWGFYPYTTWSRCTTENAFSILKHEAEWDDPISVYGVTRAYGTRHGPGPFPTEDHSLTLDHRDTTEHNKYHKWQGQFRVGWFDGVLARYAIDMNTFEGGPVDHLVITNIDHLERKSGLKVCDNYTAHGDEVFDIPRRCLQGMQRMGESLMKKEVQPEYINVTFDELVPCIEQMTSLKARILSFGPTWKDKKEIM